jgi:hypothetical protein
MKATTAAAKSLPWGPPEDIVKAPRSYTGKFLAPVLARESGRKRKRGASEAAELLPRVDTIQCAAVASAILVMGMQASDERGTGTWGCLT